MDGLQSYSSGGMPAPFAFHSVPELGSNSGKSAADYVKALKKRAWTILAIAFILMVPGAILILRLPPVYRATAQLIIEPPQYDDQLRRLITNKETFAPTGVDLQKQFVPDQLAKLRSPGILSRVLRDETVSGPNAILNMELAIADLLERLQTRNSPPNTHYFSVMLEGNDAAKTARTLNLLIELFKKQVDDESSEALQAAKAHATKSLEQFGRELQKKDEAIRTLLASSQAIGPGGRNIFQARHEQISSALIQLRASYKSFERQFSLDARKPGVADARSAARAGYRAELERERRELVNHYSRLRATVRNVRSDPYARKIRDDIDWIDRQLQELEVAPDEADDAADAILQAAREEIREFEQESDRLLVEMRGAMPQLDQYVTLRAERDQKSEQISTTAEKLSQFDVLIASQKAPVRIDVPAAEPILPVRPKRSVYLAICLIFAIGAGVGFVCVTEHFDRSVKAPEDITARLLLPLLGVVPRMRRTARNHRGRHIWTPGLPDSVDADAFRNIRASLIGVSVGETPHSTLLVTSAKAGEGKSTTALNLAATCAKAGERTLLVDVDLRRPSLHEVFPHEGPELGLVDVLRGELPWERTIIQTELPNLDFLPTGDSRGIPIEILGSLELRQLLLSLAQSHYDRVILDGPAVLGLADCRTLGRMVDATLLVVRYGALEIQAVRRAKAVLEQSRVPIAGVVFNGLVDDLDDWSSYGGSSIELGIPSPSRPALAGADA